MIGGGVGAQYFKRKPISKDFRSIFTYIFKNFRGTSLLNFREIKFHFTLKVR